MTLTTVILSTLSMKKSEVRYRESESAYSFHSCAKSDCEDAIVSWLSTKYPVAGFFGLE